MAAASLTVLLVDDEEMVRTLLRRMLERLGHHVLQASNAESALALFGHADEPIGLVISDVRLPGMSGVCLAEQLRALDASLAILLVSGAFESESGEFAKLDKPFTFEKLECRIGEVLGVVAGAGQLDPALG